jgi:hypothetical protein
VPILQVFIANTIRLPSHAVEHIKKLRSNFDEGCVGVAPREEDGGRKEGRKVAGGIIGGEEYKIQWTSWVI